ncbi:hypothetical protein [Boudabousia marimammalium]|uniref:Lipoprotein n=1 Tax=Boudabousia marimammalium TaxID=156892 RepID=A0A1Q5PRK5_9ACTO|nr:hypothetical protein [Boudabousia marimammalium]OKL50153.1 hypothetical protein BM477_01795 [Boudabousia marimammalium]
MRNYALRRVVISLFAAGSLLLTACSATIPTPVVDESRKGNINETRLVSVLDHTEATMRMSAEEKSPAPLNSRFANLGLRMRSAELAIATANNQELLPIDLSTAQATASQGSSWPRAFFNVSEITEGKAPVVSVFRQEQATENYHLNYWASLLPGAKWPSTARLESGAPLLPDTATGLVLSPRDALGAYVKLINDPNNEAKDLFESDPFMEHLRSYMSEWQSKVSEIADASMSATAEEPLITTLGLENEGALMAGGISYDITSTVKLEGSSITLTGPIQALMGDNKEVTGRLVSKRAVSLIMVIPKADSGEKIRVIGAHVTPLSVSSQSWADLHPGG